VRGYWRSSVQVPVCEIDVYGVVFDREDGYFPACRFRWKRW